MLDSSRNRSLGHLQSPGVMRKVESTGKVKATARIVSDKYRRVVSGPERPVISKPVGGQHRRAALSLTATVVLSSTYAPSTEGSTWKTVICAAVHGQTACKIKIVAVVDAPFPPSRAFAYAKEEQMDMLHNAHLLDVPMIA